MVAADAVTVALPLVAVGFVVLTGVNDGASLLAVRLRGASGRPLAALAVLTAAVVVVPAVVGTQVAVALERAAGSGPAAALVAFTSAALVVLALARRGLPTSLTLALVGALTGTAIGFGAAPPWALLVRATLLGLAAPLVGALLAWLTVRALPRLPGTRSAAHTSRWGRQLSYGATCLAYAANDGQKVLAVVLVAAAALPRSGVAGSQPVLLGLAGLLFALGAAIGLSRTVTSAVAPIRPVHAMTAEACSAVTVLGSGLVGAPVSMTQSMTGAVIGSTAAHGAGRVRWGLAGWIGLAWATTLPSALVVSAALGGVARAAGG